MLDKQLDNAALENTSYSETPKKHKTSSFATDSRLNIGLIAVDEALYLAVEMISARFSKIEHLEITPDTPLWPLPRQQPTGHKDIQRVCISEIKKYFVLLLPVKILRSRCETEDKMEIYSASLPRRGIDVNQRRAMRSCDEHNGFSAAYYHGGWQKKPTAFAHGKDEQIMVCAFGRG